MLAFPNMLEARLLADTSGLGFYRVQEPPISDRHGVVCVEQFRPKHCIWILDEIVRNHPILAVKVNGSASRIWRKVRRLFLPGHSNIYRARRSSVS